MKRHALLLSLALALLGLEACDRTPEAPDATLPPPPTEAVLLPTPITEATAPALATAAPATAAPSATVAASPTTAPPTEAATATSAAPTAEPPTAAATASGDGAATPEATATTEPPTAEAPPTSTSGVFAPGQVDGSTLAGGGAASYLVQGQRFAPLILFVEPETGLDVALAAYSGDLSGQTTPEGVTALAAADNALAGRPEILVLSPESDGQFTLVVRAASGEGNFTAHLYDLTTPAPGVAIQQSEALAGGTEKVFNVTSNGARPVIAVADPTDQSDVALDVMGADGALLTTANYSGAGGAETAYVLPLGATGLSIKIREVAGAASTFNILVITLQ